MEAAIPMNGFMELAEDDLIVVDGGGPAIAMYPVDWKGLWRKVREGFISGVAGAVATGAGQYTLQAGIGGAIAGGINYYFEHPTPTYFFVIY